ncbi:TrkH family potassium uptake protein [Chryseobacterium sp.]|uniref:TrkH family potassium uptake protein n=1 Tax=Chryseobacterium sp. TaxID=1871047 RepID=UPI0012A9C19E|nr:potassium transporter TrkG [Chryseobacterium sp.]QFG52098.1 ATPase [Chryseobacterium sp.]
MWNNRLNTFSFYTSFLAFGLMIIEAGFYKELLYRSQVIYFYDLSFLLTIFNIFYYNIYKKSRATRKLWPLEIIIILLVILYYAARLEYNFLDSRNLRFVNQRLLYLLIVLCFIRDFSSLHINFKRTFINPAQLFISSFIGIIFLGTAMLLMPNATTKEISVLDALFTSTSAVCVTGLVTLDTAKDFTVFGKIIILALIQTGGLGIMTFASYFSYFFRGGSSFENQISLSEMTSSDKLGDVFNTLKRVLVITVTVELLGAALIYLSLDRSLLGNSTNNGIMFSVFHSISSFCNAGFSTLTGGLSEPGYDYNYSLHLTIAFLFIFGGLGFPIVYNVYKYMHHLIQNILFAKITRERYKYTPWVININTRIILITTAVLLVGGTALIYLFEKDGALKNHTYFGTVVEAFFISASNRTAGFNTVNMVSLSGPTIMICMLLMWIGASPASTGGGIKTTAFAIAILNIIAFARGKSRTEVYRREISDNSVKRAFAIIALSLIIIGFAIFLLVLTEKDKDLMSLAFEVFSAYSTVGLSLNLTPTLTPAGKLIIITVMFIGRVSMLSLLIALAKREKYFNYRYPKEEIMIN